jgi:transcriptional regulator with XRE-family HTH domain
MRCASARFKPVAAPPDGASNLRRTVATEVHVGHKPPKSADHPVDVHVGARLRAMRLAKGLSARDLATPLGLSYPQIQKYEAGHNRLSVSTLHDIANLLGVPVARFFDGLPQLAPDPDPNLAFAERLARLQGAPDGLATLDAVLALPAAARAELLRFLAAASPEALAADAASPT